jgi:hypothetical protein
MDKILIISNAIIFTIRGDPRISSTRMPGYPTYFYVIGMNCEQVHKLAKILSIYQDKLFYVSAADIVDITITSPS